MADKRRSRIFIADQEHGLPYSKGLTASSLMVTGLGPVQAYAVANKVEQELLRRGHGTVSEEQLTRLTLQVLRREVGETHAEAFVKWRSVAELDIPLVILIGGATGVGKSTIATQLATRLGITRVISTDAVREVLRSAFTAEMFPTLYESSFQADKAVRQPIPHAGDRLIIGFREQAAAVAVGARALIDRALSEGTDLILEGAHLVPGFLDIETDRAAIVPVVVKVDDEDLHRSHFYWRTRERPSNRYLNNFQKIRRIQKYIVSSALLKGVPIISHYDLDVTLSQMIDHVVTKALETVERSADLDGDKARAKAGAKDELLESAVDSAARRKGEGSSTRETVS